MKFAHVHTVLAQVVKKTGRKAQAPHGVNQQAHLDTGLRALTKRSRKDTPHGIITQDVGLEMHTLPGGGNRRQHGGKGLTTTAQRLHRRMPLQTLGPAYIGPIALRDMRMEPLPRLRQHIQT